MRQTFIAENTLSSILNLIHESVAFLKDNGASARALFIGELVLEEMLTNTVKYGYDDQRKHRIEVIAEVDAGRVGLEIRDDGREFDPLQAPPPTFGEPAKTQRMGGRGIYVVKKVVEKSSYRREDGWNILNLDFPLKTGAATG